MTLERKVDKIYNLLQEDWISEVEAAKFCDVTKKYFAEKLRKSLPESAIKQTINGKRLYNKVLLIKDQSKAA